MLNGKKFLKKMTLKKRSKVRKKRYLKYKIKSKDFYFALLTKILKTIKPVIKFIIPKKIFLQLQNYVVWLIKGKNCNNIRAVSVLDELQIVSTEFSERKDQKLVICCAFTGRYEILSRSINESFAAQNGNKIRWFLCGTTADDLKFIQDESIKNNRVSGMLWKNNPLGSKWQSCVSAAGALFDARLFAITGSDDILSSKLIDYVIDKEAEDTTKNSLPAMYSSYEWAIINTSDFNFRTPSIFSCAIKTDSSKIPLGAGRFYTKDFMKKVRFRVFDTNLENQLDDYGFNEINNIGDSVRTFTFQQGPIISVKGNWQQMNTSSEIVATDAIVTEEKTFNLRDEIKESISIDTYNYLFPSNYEFDFVWE